jgi:hypothetical protein
MVLAACVLDGHSLHETWMDVVSSAHLFWFLKVTFIDM